MLFCMQCDRPVNDNGIQTPPRSYARWKVVATSDSYIGFISSDKERTPSGFDNVVDNSHAREVTESEQTSLPSLSTNNIPRKPHVDFTQKASSVKTPNFSRIPDEPGYSSLEMFHIVEWTFL